MNKPKFTQEQEDFICYQIGEWYLNWKHSLINWDERTHRLGYAKEKLKEMIVGTPDEYEKPTDLNDIKRRTSLHGGCY